MTIPPLIRFDHQRISKKEVLIFLPSYTLELVDIPIGKLTYVWYKILINIIKLFVKVRLRAIGYRTFTSSFSQEEAEHVYTREAKDYEWKHHVTTNFRDTWWRRSLAFDVLNYIRKNQLFQGKITLLDIGTGIGLSLEEMFKIFKHFNVNVFAYGLDFNQAMLQEARRVVLPRMREQNLLNNEREIQFVRGDGRNISGEKEKKDGFSYFKKNSIDCITIMFGMGGIHLPYDSFREQLIVLREKGIVTMIDIHSPLLFLRSHWPWYLNFLNYKALEFLAWKEGTVPLVLRKVWGWQDPTTIFYKAPLVSYYDKEAKIYFGFNVLHFSYANEPWWFGLPFMNTVRLVMEKTIISKEEFDQKQKVLDSLS